MHLETNEFLCLLWPNPGNGKICKDQEAYTGGPFAQSCVALLVRTPTYKYNTLFEEPVPSRLYSMVLLNGYSITGNIQETPLQLSQPTCSGRSHVVFFEPTQKQSFRAPSGSTHSRIAATACTPNPPCALFGKPIFRGSHVQLIASQIRRNPPCGVISLLNHAPLRVPLLHTHIYIYTSISR